MWKSTLCLAFAVLAAGIADEPTGSVSEYLARGEKHFRANEIAKSVRNFEQAIAIEPQIRPQLWQLGISYYYAGEFEKGRKLFESHRLVNPHDVENAAWHFLCAARESGVETARANLIEIDTRRDQRVPMTQVYDLYAGQGTAKAVLEAAAKARTQRAMMYAHLYLGLYFEVSKKPKLARTHMQQSAAAKLTSNYMHDVAKVHLLRRKWQTEK